MTLLLRYLLVLNEQIYYKKWSSDSIKTIEKGVMDNKEKTEQKKDKDKIKDDGGNRRKRKEGPNRSKIPEETCEIK